MRGVRRCRWPRRSPRRSMPPPLWKPVRAHSWRHPLEGLRVPAAKSSPRIRTRTVPGAAIWAEDAVAGHIHPVDAGPPGRRRPPRDAGNAGGTAWARRRAAMGLTIGVDIGGTKIAAGVVDEK